MVRSLQPGIKINDRLPGQGDFDTPEKFLPAVPPVALAAGLGLTWFATRPRLQPRWGPALALGLVLGTIGLGAVLLRNVLERRGEIALLRAVGFRKQTLAVMLVLLVAQVAYRLALGTPS